MLPDKFSKENDMVPDWSEIPADEAKMIRRLFRALTTVEERLIAPIAPIMSLYTLPNGRTVHRGYVANFSQDICSLVKELPRLPSDVPIAIFKRANQENEMKEFKVQ
jgi:hypothetical protein